MSGSGLRAGNGETRAALFFYPHCPRADHHRAGPIPLRSSQASHVDPVDLSSLPGVSGGGDQCPLPTRQALRPWGPSRTIIMFLSYALRGATPTGGSACGGQTAHAHPATPTLRTAAPRLHARPALVPTGNCTPTHKSTNAV